ncbi:MAG: Ku protein [Terriglobales bacterium]
MAVVWSGYLSFGLVTLPVRLFSGARGERVSFHLLHAKDRARLRQQMVCPEDGAVVSRGESLRGYEYAKDEYVTLSEEEIRQAAPKTQKQMEIVAFCRAEELDPLWFEASYYLVPEAAGRGPHRLLLAAMERSGYIALAKISMHNREYAAALRPTRLAGVPDLGGQPAGLLLHTLYYADEIRVAEGFGAAAGEGSGAPIAAAELQLAEQLIGALARPFEARQFHDTYRERLEALVAAKLEGRAAAPRETVPKLAPVVDLMEALKRSLAEKSAAGKKEPAPAARASGGKKTARSRKRPAA